MIVNPDLLASLAKSVKRNCEHEWERYGHANMRCKKCGILAKIGFMEMPRKEGGEK